MRRRISFAIVAALAASLFVPLAGPPASATSTFTFYGSGYGHGIGMSQWGAYGLAQMGWSHQQILTHFYEGTSVDTPTLPSKIRIGLTDDRTVVHLTAEAGPVRIWEGSPKGGSLVGEIPDGDTWTIAPKDGAYSVKDGTGALVGGTRWGAADTDLIVTYADAGSRVFIPEADAIWDQGFSYSRGTIELNLYSCGDANGCAERLIARLGLEDYLDGLGEVPASWPMEAMEAQAVAARSYAVYAIERSGIRSSCNCHLTDGSGDQTYIGFDREGGTDGDRWLAAVDATRGEVVTYGGDVIQAFYAASDGGHSQSVEDAWHGGASAYAIPWLTGVCDPGESTRANPWVDWQTSFDASSLASRLSPYTGSIGVVTAFRDIVRDGSGRIMSLTVVGADGEASVTGTELKAALSLYDERVWINSDRNVTGPIREKYDALMCGPGLPASPVTRVAGGAQQYFQVGGLYRNANTGLTIWLRGPIDAEYRAVGAGAGSLGVPETTPISLADVRAISCAKCRRVDFVGGRIYWKAGVGAYALWGPLLDAYLAAGGAQGNLGFPTTRVRTTTAGATHASFEHGRIDCPSGGGVCSVTVA